MTAAKTPVLFATFKDPHHPDNADALEDVVEKATTALKAGKVVAFPTDTVYGLGASVFNSEAVEKIYQIKERPSEKPLSVLIGSAKEMDNVAAKIPNAAVLLAKTFWPGPLTIILNKNSKIPDTVTRSKKTIGLRVPNHPVALALIQKAGPLACPSANISGKTDPTSAQDVLADLDGKIDLLIDGGETKIQIPSTIIDMTENPPKILRTGGLSIDEIKKCIGDVQ
ncbi:L-threonylcarbamoyladenylate synthase [Methanolapillus ohkumae]|uniref:L-threonylcarbamoyladenylate synthase n=1 Tax=Methanolapillus ohkumae TaxID=3028298 RepID=A0AA96V6X7_9EURY|nr:Threonylcarbamoyl-AMP synthase [Methanosarcinaceae archaeon Am2]